MSKLEGFEHNAFIRINVLDPSFQKVAGKTTSEEFIEALENVAKQRAAELHKVNRFDLMVKNPWEESDPKWDLNGSKLRVWDANGSGKERDDVAEYQLGSALLEIFQAVEVLKKHL